uniref:Uncharacterized protein n=1 Tax=Elaeophora elaphi TaxID=1147741 RepID=A0A0R3RNL2_9BILA
MANHNNTTRLYGHRLFNKRSNWEALYNAYKVMSVLCSNKSRETSKYIK